jgi:hypothetical protein
VTFNYRPTIPSSLSSFLQDCYNRDKVIATYQQNKESFALALKVPLPLGICEAHLLSADHASSFRKVIEELRHLLLETEPAKQFATLASYTAVLPAIPIPSVVLARLERYVPEADFTNYVLPLGSAPQLLDTNIPSTISPERKAELR